MSARDEESPAGVRSGRALMGSRRAEALPVSACGPGGRGCGGCRRVASRDEWIPFGRRPSLLVTGGGLGGRARSRREGFSSRSRSGCPRAVGDSPAPSSEGKGLSPRGRTTKKGGGPVGRPPCRPLGWRRWSADGNGVWLSRRPKGVPNSFLSLTASFIPL